MLRPPGLFLLTALLAPVAAGGEGRPAAAPAEKVLLPGPGGGRARYYDYAPLMKPFRPWKIDWEAYPYRDFYPCVADHHVAARPADDRPPEKVVHYNEGTRGAAIQAGRLLAVHFGEYPKGGPPRNHPGTVCKETDWRGYDLLRMDFRCTGDVHVWWAIEDQAVSPPVVGNFDVKGKDWATLEIDLAEAVKGRGLDLAGMWAMFLWADPSPGETTSWQNVRLARRGTPAQYPILGDPKAATLPPHPKRQPPPKPDLAPDATPLPAPRTLVFKSDTPISMNQPHGRTGFVAVYDAAHVLLGMSDRAFRWYNAKGQPGDERPEVFVTQTLDGGRSWRGLDGDKERSWLHVTVRPAAAVLDDIGGAMLWNKDGCDSNPGPRERVTKFSFLGAKGWTFNRKDYVFNCENYHCGSAWEGVWRAPSGRIWAAFHAVHRLLDPGTGIHVTYSDNDGAGWHNWKEGRLAWIPGSRGYWSGGTYVVPWEKGIVVVWSDGKSYVWSAFDGEKWTAPAPAYSKYLRSAVCVGGKDALLGGWGQGVKRFDGSDWVVEPGSPHTPGELCVSGGSVAAINPAHGEKGFAVYWRSPAGEWDKKPQIIETGPIAAWRVPKFGPATCAAVMYMARDNNKEVRVLLVPNKHLAGR